MSKKKISAVTTKSETIAIVSDIHFDLHDPTTWLAFKKWFIDIKPEKLVVLGDFIDLGMMSRYVQGRNMPVHAIPQIQMFVKEMNELRDLHPTVKLIIAEGNHDERWQKMVLGVSPHVYKDALGLTLEDQCISQGLRPGFLWTREDLVNKGLKCGPFVLRHGHNQGGRFGGGRHLAANRLTKSMGKSEVFGHHHRAQMFFQTSMGITACAIANPCQPAFATVLTPEGIKTFADIDVNSTIWSGSDWTRVIKKWSTGVKPVYKYVTNSGEFVGTENHRVVSNGIKVEVSKTKTIDTSVGVYSNLDKEALAPEDVLDGLVFGDELSLTYERVIPERIVRSSTAKKLGFLRGVYTANGSVLGDRISVCGSSELAMRGVQQLLSSVGIHSVLYKKPSKTVKFSNGEFDCKPNFVVSISGDRHKFRTSIGFIQHYKNDALNTLCNRFDRVIQHKSSYEITNKQSLGEHEVFDITVESVHHTYWTGGLLVSNCMTGDHEYANDPDWQRGFTVIELYGPDNKYANGHPIVMNNGHFAYHGKVYDGNI